MIVHVEGYFVVHCVQCTNVLNCSCVDDRYLFFKYCTCYIFCACTMCVSFKNSFLFQLYSVERNNYRQGNQNSLTHRHTLTHEDIHVHQTLQSLIYTGKKCNVWFVRASG